MYFYIRCRKTHAICIWNWVLLIEIEIAHALAKKKNVNAYCMLWIEKNAREKSIKKNRAVFVNERFKWWNIHISLSIAQMHRVKKKTNNTNNGCSFLTYINKLCLFVYECVSAIAHAHNNNVPAKYQIVSYWIERFMKSISSRILKIATNVLNLVYNCDKKI